MSIGKHWYILYFSLWTKIYVGFSIECIETTGPVYTLTFTEEWNTDLVDKTVVAKTVKASS